MVQRGRVPKGEYANKSKVLSTRIREDTRKALENAALASGRSLSQEIEYRLRRSFDEDRKLIEVFGSRKNYGILRMISSVMDLSGNLANPEKTWLEDPYAFEMMKTSVSLVLDAIKPIGEPVGIVSGVEDQTSMARLEAHNKTARFLQIMASAERELPTPDSSQEKLSPEHRVARKAPAIKDALGAIANRIDDLEFVMVNSRGPIESTRRKGRSGK
jgi:hypothetical protein